MKKKIIFWFIVVLLLMSSALAVPNVIEVSRNVYADSRGWIVAEVTFKNIGTAMTSNYIFEIQPRQQTFSFVSVSQAACDNNFPKNVHKEFLLGAGESVEVRLESSVPDGRWQVYGLTVNTCCPTTPTCYDVQPYGWGTHIGEAVIDTSSSTWCGDGTCDADETKQNCPKDCGVDVTPPNPEVCGNDRMDAGENCDNCKKDLPDDYCKAKDEEKIANFAILGIIGLALFSSGLGIAILKKVRGVIGK